MIWLSSFYQAAVELVRIRITKRVCWMSRTQMPSATMWRFDRRLRCRLIIIIVVSVVVIDSNNNSLRRQTTHTQYNKREAKFSRRQTSNRFSARRLLVIERFQFGLIGALTTGRTIIYLSLCFIVVVVVEPPPMTLAPSDADAFSLRSKREGKRDRHANRAECLSIAHTLTATNQ